jgi:hypothetical protein
LLWQYILAFVGDAAVVVGQHREAQTDRLGVVADGFIVLLRMEVRDPAIDRLIEF